MKKFYAKSQPDILTIPEHTKDVVTAVGVLRRTYGGRLPLLKEKDWLLLETAAAYHDVGKYSDGFQNSIKSSLGLLRKDRQLVNYPHNYLSVALIPFEDLEEEMDLDLEDSDLLTLIIGYHHEREKSPVCKEIQAIFDQQLKFHLNEIETELGIKVSERPDSIYLEVLEHRQGIWKNNRTPTDLQKRYILLKGLLHRADYAASAKRKHEPVELYVEQGVDQSIAESTKQYMELNNFELRSLQKFTDSHQEKNILLVAQTGSGKTEAALLWIGGDKGFVTLPLRVSLNAMFDRIHDKGNIAFAEAKLLHSGAFDHLSGDTKDEENETNSYQFTTQHIQYAQLLSAKLTLSTIDQIFKFPLLYKGFERELATLAYSKVVIDEIQAYDPHIVAILIRGLEMLQQLGGKWMIMTATLPEIFLEELKSRKLLESSITAQKTVLLPDDRDGGETSVPRRHRLHLIDESIVDCVEKIREFAIGKKVLVVVNTVQRALEVYDALNGEERSDVFLLHGQFIARDRNRIEDALKTFGQLDDNRPGIWVTTQIVEASIDVDFDYLFTEAATPDALFQRFGRCNRKGKRPVRNGEGLTPSEPNVFICTDEVTGLDAIYEGMIVENGLEALGKYDGELIDEQAKLDIVKDVFSNEKLLGSEYLEEFQSSLKELYNITPFNIDSKQAQKILRDIKSCLVIPGLELYNEAKILMEQYYAVPKDDQVTKKKILRELNQLSVSVNPYRLEYRRKEEGFTCTPLDKKVFSHYLYADVKYTETRGLELACDNVHSRFL